MKIILKTTCIYNHWFGQRSWITDWRLKSVYSGMYSWRFDSIGSNCWLIGDIWSHIFE